MSNDATIGTEFHLSSALKKQRKEKRPQQLASQIICLKNNKNGIALEHNLS